MSNDDPLTQISNQGTEAAAIIDAARHAGQPHRFDSVSEVFGVLVPPDAEHRLVDLERYLAYPHRKRGHVVVHEPVSLADYVRRHATASTALYADVRDGTVTAVLNDHQPESGPDESVGEAGWGDHRAVLDLRPSHEWKVWTNLDGKGMGQTAFAEHLEDNYLDIVDPDHATMLEIAQSIEATSSGNFKSRQRLQDGQVALRYEETVDARAGTKGDLTIPETFTVALRVWEGLDPVELTCRLRYRIRDGQLSIGYKLERLDDIKDKAFAQVVDTVEQHTDHTCLRGAAPNPVTAGR